MDNSIVLGLIKKDLEELQILVEELQKDELPQQLLIDITIGRTKTLLQEFSLLQGVKTSMPTEETAAITEKDEVQLLQEVPEPEIETEEPAFIPAGEPDFIEEELAEAPLSEAPVESETEESIAAEKEDEPFETISEEPILQAEESELQIKIDEVEEVIVEPEVVIEAPMPEPEIKEEMPAEVQPVVEPQSVQEVQAEAHELEMEQKVDEKKVLGEKFVKEPTLNERLSSGTSQESKIKGKPVTSLRKAIGLNDKFMFTRELFGNDHSKFDQSIAYLDNCNNLLEAIDYLEKNFKWTKSETSLKFIALLKQRFSN